MSIDSKELDIKVTNDAFEQSRNGFKSGVIFVLVGDATLLESMMDDTVITNLKYFMLYSFTDSNFVSFRDKLMGLSEKEWLMNGRHLFKGIFSFPSLFNNLNGLR